MSTINDLIDLDIRVGVIEEAIPFPEARVPAYKLKINFGPSGFRQTSAQLTRRYQPEDLIGRKIVAALGLPPLRVAGYKSECLVLGSVDGEGDVILLHPNEDALIGWPIR